MAIVFRSEKKSVSDVGSHQITPGPGTYLQLEEYQHSKAYAPFLSTAGRSKSLKKEEDTPGPGSYNIAGDLTSQTQRLLVSTLNPDPKELEKPKLSNVFKSTTQRFDDRANKQADFPGPGMYHKEEPFGKKIKNIPGSNAQKKEIVQNMLKMNKYLSIPSIPSNVHGYGYTENDTNELILNKNPLVEAYKLVGPGYYNPKAVFETGKTKGLSWHRSGTRRFGGPQKRSITAEGVGPGSYELSSQFMPLYKLKQSSGFASTTRRTLDAKVRQQPTNKMMMSKSYQSFGGRDFGAAQEGEEPLDMEEYIDNSTPGPGYYHNESIASSIKVQYKPERLQSFGTRAARFKEFDTPGATLGPGDYDIAKDINPKIKKGESQPFHLSNGRYDKTTVFKTPGPGAYDPKINLKDQLEKKVKSSYQGNFGTTDRRFKANAQLEDLPGPGTYLQVKMEPSEQAVAKNSSVFASTSKRETITVRNVVPAPNTYNLDNLTMARAIIKEEDEDPELMPKREPFNSSQARFKPLKKEPEVEDPHKFSRTAEAYAKSKMKPKKKQEHFPPTRADLHKPKEGPAPGAYYNPDNNQWVKRTYNILFAED